MVCVAYLPQSHKLTLSLAALLLPLLAGAAVAEDPDVQFDCDPTVVCRDITPVDFSLSNPDEKIIEATIRISTRMTQVQPKTLLNWFTKLKVLWDE